MTTTTVAARTQSSSPLNQALKLLSDWRYMTRRNLIRLVRNPEKLLFNIMQTLMFVLLFRYVFGGAISTPNGSYVDFLMPGIIVQSATFISVSTAVGLADDMSKGIVDRFRAMPIGRSALLAGRLISDSMENMILLVATVICGVIVGWSLDTTIPAFIAMLAMALLIGLAVASIGAWTALLLKTPELVQSFGLLWIFPLIFVSGIFVPVETLPGGLKTFAEINPVTVWTQLLRDLSMGETDSLASGLAKSLAWIGGIVVIFGALTVRAYRKIS